MFGNKLSRINTQAPLSSIKGWKEDPDTKSCYAKLFKKIKQDNPTTFMARIIEKIFKERRNAPKVQIAFAISICETYLNPDEQSIQINEVEMKLKITKNLVSF